MPSIAMEPSAVARVATRLIAVVSFASALLIYRTHELGTPWHGGILLVTLPTGLALVAAAAWALGPLFGRRAPAELVGHAVVKARTLTAIDQSSLPIPDPARLVHLQFRRFAGCPVCHLHLRSFVMKESLIDAAGIREIVVFHAPAAELRLHAANLPKTVIADPDRELYREFGVESSPRALLDPRAWSAIARGVVRSGVDIGRGLARPPAMRPHGGRFGLPADFLIARDGRILAANYGEHADDQWSVEELLRIAQDAAPR